MSLLSIICTSDIGVHLCSLTAVCIKFAIWIQAISLFDGTKHSTNEISVSVNCDDRLSIIALSFSNTLSGICICIVLIVLGEYKWP